MPGHWPPWTILKDGAKPGIMKLFASEWMLAIASSSGPNIQIPIPVSCLCPSLSSGPRATPILHPASLWPARKSVRGPCDSKGGRPQGLSQPGPSEAHRGKGSTPQPKMHAQAGGLYSTSVREGSPQVTTDLLLPQRTVPHPQSHPNY